VLDSFLLTKSDESRINLHSQFQVENVEISFKNKTLEEVSNRFLILGDNGTGKTTLLQAIALPLALATKQIQSN
jgi:predicted NACHT family NTPase